MILESLKSQDHRVRVDAKGGAYGMRTKAETTSRRLGDDRNETANKAPPLDKKL